MRHQTASLVTAICWLPPAIPAFPPSGHGSLTAPVTRASFTSYRTTPAQIAYQAATFEAELQAVAFGRGISVVPETAPRRYSRPGIAFVAIDGVPECEVAVVHRADTSRAAVNFAQIAVKTVTGPA